MSINSFTGMAVPPRDRGRRYRMEAGIGWPREGRHHKDKERFLGAFGTSKWRVGKRIGRGKISGDYRLMGRRGGTRARCARSGWRWSGRYRKMPTSRQWSARGSGRAGPSTALPNRVGAGRAGAKLCGLGFGGASGPATAGRFGGFVEQVAFRLQPVLQLISGSAAALEVDFIGAKPDLFRCWMSFGSSRLGLRRWSNVHGLGHEFLLPFVSSGRSKATEQSIEQGRAKRARET